MKKYIAPSISDIEMETLDMIAASLDNLQTEQAEQGSSEAPVNYSREFSLWEDDEF